MREQELFAAAKKLSLHEVSVLDYDDGELAASDAGKVVGDLVSHIRRIRPEVVGSSPIAPIFAPSSNKHSDNCYPSRSPVLS